MDSLARFVRGSRFDDCIIGSRVERLANELGPLELITPITSISFTIVHVLFGCPVLIILLIENIKLYNNNNFKLYLADILTVYRFLLTLR